jgi:hypothetical protein
VVLQIKLLRITVASGWTEERKQRHRERIQEWRPWEKSTGPRSVEGKAKVARNAFSGGLWLTLRVLSVKTTKVIKDLKATGQWPPAPN